jgi:CoA transferase family III/MaoC dehydratase-like protein
LARLYFDELTIGQASEHAIRHTVTEADNELFFAMTNNTAVPHLDEDYCRAETEFGSRFVNGAFTICLMVGISVGDTTLGTTIANLGCDEVRIPEPVFGGYVRSPISPIDQMTGSHAFSGILASLLERERTGDGGTVKVSLLETAMGLLGYNLQTYWERGVQPAKCGSSHESLCPYQAFDASDGAIMIGVANDRLWHKFC